MNHINLNGKITPRHDAGLPVDNRAFRYGYGLFETMLVRDGEVQLSMLHGERLMNGMEQLGFAIPKHFNFSFLADQIVKTAAKGKQEALCRVRLQVFAGSGGLMDGVSMQPQYLIECYPVDASTINLNKNGMVLGVASDLKKAADSLANLKSSNALLYAIAARQAKQHKWNDALICNTDGNVIESTIANLFWIINEKIYTPPLTDGCIDGVMRKNLIQKLKLNNIRVVERSITPEELMEVDEIFLTNAIRNVKWVGTIGAKHFQNHIIENIVSTCF